MEVGLTKRMRGIIKPQDGSLRKVTECRKKMHGLIGDTCKYSFGSSPSIILHHKNLVLKADKRRIFIDGKDKSAQR
jgi:hypothetical protein